MINLKATMDSRALTGFNRAMRSQVPYATALALTNVAKLVESNLKSKLAKGRISPFITRNVFTSGSIKRINAQKKDWPNCRAQVGSIAPYMALQEDGGTKAPGSKAFAIPKGIRSSETQLVSRKRWPAKILDPNSRIPGGGRPKGSKNGKRKPPKPFLMKEKSGVGVYVRMSRRGRAIKRLYRLTRSSIHVKGRHWFVEPSTRIVNANLENEFLHAMAKALATKR